MYSQNKFILSSLSIYLRNAMCQLNAGENTEVYVSSVCILGTVSCYIVALASNIFATSFNDFYQQIPAFGNFTWELLATLVVARLTEAASR